MRERVASLVRGIDERITIHDFRMVRGATHTNVIFDAVVPYDVDLGEKEAAEKIAALVASLDGTYYAAVNIDKTTVK